MDSTLVESPIHVLPLPAAAEPTVRQQVWNVLSAMYPGARPDRRRYERFPFPRLTHLLPVADDGATPTGHALVVAGKHLSEKGLGFYHPGPLPHRLAIASLESQEEHWLSFLMDINWCRFSGHGWYESGGRFLRPIPWQREFLG